MENALKGLMLAAGTVITCLLVAFGFHAAEIARENAAAEYKALNAYEKRLEENNYLVYDGAVITGSELLNLLRYELNKSMTGNGYLVYFEVVDKTSKRLTKPEELKELVNPKSSVYVLPYRAYRGETVWEDCSLIALRFTGI